jgi:hypothetical protein
MSKRRGRNSGVCVGDLHQIRHGNTAARRTRRQGGAGLLSAQGGVVEVVWGSCGEELREGKGLSGI